MRKTLLLLLLAIGCTSTTEIPRRLPAALTVTYGDVAGDSSVTVKDDSIVATATLWSSCAGPYRVEAGNVADEIMIVVSDAQTAVQTCMLSSRYRTFRVAVAGAPAGRYPVQLDYEPVIGGRAERSMLVRQAVSLP